MAQEVVGYLDYLTNNGERYFPYTRVEGIINTDGTPFSNWIAEVNIHNHDTRYSLIDHTHSNYALSSHTHLYAGSDSVGGAANTALSLDKAFTLNVTGSEVGSVDIKGDSNVTLSLTANHDHVEYIKNTGNNTITALNGIESPLTILSDGGRAKIDLYSTSSTNRSYIEFLDSKFRLAYNEVPFDLDCNGVYFNSNEILHRGLIDIDAHSLDGLDIDNLPFVKNNVDIVSLANNKIAINTSDAAKTDITINTSGDTINLSVSENSTDIIISIKSGDTNLFSITKDKSTSQVRTDLFGSVYVNGVELSV